ncbi:MAG: alpha/beta fold hydrolase [Dehalococcoidia bacterium]
MDSSLAPGTPGNQAQRAPVAEAFLRPFMKLAAVQPGERVLDLASAYPEPAIEAARRSGDQGETLAVGPSTALLERIATAGRAAGLSTLRAEVMDPGRLTLPDTYWDVALCYFGLGDLAEPEALFREALRVLRPVGRMAVAALGERDRCVLVTAFLDAVAAHAPAAVKAAGATLFKFSAPGRLSGFLAEQGFQDAVPERLTEWVPFSDVDEYWATMTASDLGYLAEGLSDDAVAQCKAEIERKTRFYRRRDHLELKVDAIILALVKRAPATAVAQRHALVAARRRRLSPTPTPDAASARTREGAMTTDAVVHDTYVTVNGLRLHAREWGDPAAAPVVFLHGLRARPHLGYDGTRCAGQQVARVLALDQRGRGESAFWADDYAPNCWQDLEGFVRAVALERFMLVGLSQGGRVAYHTLPPIRRGSHASSSSISAPRCWRRAAPASRPRPAASRSTTPRTPCASATAPARPRDELRATVLNNLVRRDDGRWTWRYDPEAVARRRPAGPAEEQWALLPHITCPTLVVRGAMSDILGAETAARMAAVMPDCRVAEVANAGHTVQVDNPDGFIAAVRPFLFGEPG